MAFDATAATLLNCLGNSANNVFTMSEQDPDVDMKARLVSWRTGTFALLDRNDPDQARIHQWIVPVLALEGELSNELVWWQIQEIVNVMNYTFVALGSDGYTPAAPLEASIVAVYNSVWSAV